ALAYGRGIYGPEVFPRQVEDLIGWLSDALEDEHPFRRVRAMPRSGGMPEVWLLGSGGSSAEYAAQMGCGYSFAQFISGVDGAEMVRAYRERFRPSSRLAAPQASVGIGVICAETTAEAERLSLSLQLWRGRIAQGKDRGIPSPEEAEAEFAEAGVSLDALRHDPRVITGDPATARAELRELARHYGVEELMVVTVTHSFEARIRSYELL